MSDHEPIYGVRASVPDFVERERAQVLSLAVWRDGALVVPTAGTVTIQRPDGTNLVSAAAATITSGIAQYSLSAPAATEPLSSLWLQIWSLTLDGIVRPYRREMILCRRALYPTVTEQDLIDEYLDVQALLGKVLQSFQGFIDLAWKEILRDLINRGFVPQLIVSAGSLFDWHRHLTFVYLFKAALRAQSSDRWATLLALHQEAAKAAAVGFTASIDADEDGKADDTSRMGGSVIVHPNAAPTSQTFAGRTRGRW